MKWLKHKIYTNYSISDTGLVRNDITGKILKACKSHNYYVVRLGGRNGKMYLLHRLVAEAFIPNQNNYPEINHRDENPNNNNWGK